MTFLYHPTKPFALALIALFAAVLERFKIYAKGAKLSSFFLAVSLGLISVKVAANQEDTERAELVDQILDIQGAQFLGEEYTRFLIEGMRSMFDNAAVDTDSEFFGSLSNVIDEVVYEELVLTGELRQSLIDELAPFDNAELKAMLEFYQTPAGRKLIEQSTKALETKPAEQVAMFDKLSEKITQRFETRIKEEGLSPLDLGVKRDSPSARPSSAQLAELADQTCDVKQDSDKRLPIYRGPPTYPHVARSYSIEGWVDLDFTIRTDGTTEDVRVVKSSPGVLFNDAAVTAVRDYLYCPGAAPEAGQLRVRFEMEKEGSESSSSHSAGKTGANTKKLAFLSSADFLVDLKKFSEKTARRAYSVADDGGDKWVSSWYYGFRFQADANAAALKRCYRSRLKAKIKEPCQILIEGDRLGKTFADNLEVKKVLDEALVGDYEEKSGFELALEDYDLQLFAKAMAIAEKDNGAYYYHSSWSWQTQEEANDDALKKCNENKADDITADCYLYMVGDYRGHEIPKLEAMRGVWEGSIETKIFGLEANEDRTLRVRLDNCGDHPKVFVADSDPGDFQRLHRLFDISQDTGNVILSSVENGGEWVETQVWTFIELGEETAALQRNRMVSNIDLDLDEELRSFGTLAEGVVNRVEQCDF